MARRDDNLDILENLLGSLIKEKEDKKDEDMYNFIFTLIDFFRNREKYNGQEGFLELFGVVTDRVYGNNLNLIQVLEDIIKLMTFIKSLPEDVQIRLTEIYGATGIQTKELVPFYIALRVNYIWFVYYTLGHQRSFRRMLNVWMYIDLPEPVPTENMEIGVFYPLNKDVYQFFASVTATLIRNAALRDDKQMTYREALNDSVISGIRAIRGEKDEFVEGEIVSAIETEEILEGDPNLNQPDVIVIHPKVVERGEKGIFRKYGFMNMMAKNKATTEEERKKMVERVIREYQWMLNKDKESQKNTEEERREMRRRQRFEEIRKRVLSRKKIEESKPKFNTIRGTKEIEEEIQKISRENEDLIMKRNSKKLGEREEVEMRILLNGRILARLRKEMEESSDIERVLGLFGEAKQGAVAEDHNVKKKKEVDAAPQGDFVDFVTEKNIEEKEKRMEEVANTIEHPDVVTGKAMEEDVVEEITTIDLTSLPSTPVTSQDIQMQFEEPIKKEPGTE